MGDHLLYGGLAGLLASVIAGIVLTATGAISSIVAATVNSTSAGIGWAVLLVTGTALGLVYSVLAQTRNVAKGTSQGAGYGLAVGVFVAWLATFALAGIPLNFADATMWWAIGGGVIWGAITGAAYAYALDHYAAPPMAGGKKRVSRA